MSTTPRPEPGRLSARPGTPPAGEAAPGQRGLGIAERRDTLIYVPAGYRPERPAPLALMLHGANGVAEHGLAQLQPLADGLGLLVVAPASRGRTWDVLVGGYGPDVALIDRSLAAVFARYAVDGGRLAVGGFSDGASYALSLGLMNGDLFSHIIAFSPGFMAPERLVGQPRVFISHGVHDDVLPIDRCSRRIFPRLEAEGYAVDYREFDGPHTIPAAIARAAAGWFAGPPAKEALP